MKETKVWISPDITKSNKIIETTMIGRIKGAIIVPSINFPGAQATVLNGYWHKSKQKAIESAEQKRSIMIEWHKSKIEKFEAMVFE